MLETLQDFADERLVERGEQPRWAQAHALYMADIAQVAASGIESLAEGAWMRRLASDVDDLRAAQASGRERKQPSARRRRCDCRQRYHFAYHQMRHEMLIWADVAVVAGCGRPSVAAGRPWIGRQRRLAARRPPRRRFGPPGAGGGCGAGRPTAHPHFMATSRSSRRFDDAIAVFEEQRALACARDPGSGHRRAGAMALTRTDAGRPDAARASADEALGLAETWACRVGWPGRCTPPGVPALAASRTLRSRCGIRRERSPVRRAILDRGVGAGPRGGPARSPRGYDDRPDLDARGAGTAATAEAAPWSGSCCAVSSRCWSALASTPMP